MGGAGKLLNPAVRSPAKTGGLSWRSTSPEFEVTVQADGAIIIREGHGTGEGHGTSPAEIHDIALKAAETDATKRALATFGKPFGLELYRGGRTASQKPLPSSPLVPVPARLGFHPDDTTPIPRPSRYYGRPQDLVTRDRAQARRELKVQPVADTPIGPETPSLAPAQIDKSVPKRARDKAHLRFVASQPCLLCGRQPSDPHHVRFAQPGAMGRKVSDEFTVPLCRTHHREVHRYGDEAAWWTKCDLDPLITAANLWRQTHPLPARPHWSDSDGSVVDVQNIANGKDAGVQTAIQDSPHDKTNPIIPTGSQ